MLNISNNLRIRKADAINLVVEEFRDVVSKKDKTIKKQWIVLGYYGNLQDAITGCLNKKLFDSIEQEQDLKEIKDLIINTKNELLEALKDNKVILI